MSVLVTACDSTLIGEELYAASAYLSREPKLLGALKASDWAKAVFGLDSALLVTQAFHLPRALFVCNALGLKAEGVEAANRRYWPVMSFIWNVREQFATVAALVDVYVSRPKPVLGEPQPIFSTRGGGAGDKNA